MLEFLKKVLSRDNTEMGEFANKTVLIVDDNPVDRKIIEKTLTKLGCRVLLAEDGEKGLQMAISQNPDIILSDCNMPKMDGVEMCLKLREHERTRDVPVIFLTGVNSPKKVVECFELEAYNYMCKPINSKILSSQIKEILQEHLISS